MPDPTGTQPYVPIACGFHDRLEAWAIRRETVTVAWREGAATRTKSAQIEDVYADAQADWIRLSTGETIRADALIAVNDIPLPPAC